MRIVTMLTLSLIGLVAWTANDRWSARNREATVSGWVSVSGTVLRLDPADAKRVP